MISDTFSCAQKFNIFIHAFTKSNKKLNFFFLDILFSFLILSKLHKRTDSPLVAATFSILGTKHENVLKHRPVAGQPNTCLHLIPNPLMCTFIPVSTSFSLHNKPSKLKLLETLTTFCVEIILKPRNLCVKTHLGIPPPLPHCTDIKINCKNKNLKIKNFQSN